MAEGTKIEWADHTFNPWTGCTKVSPACDHCYAEGWAKRSGTVQWGAHAERRRTTPANWRLPLKWNDQAAAFQAQHGRRQRVFCASLADVFDNQVDPMWRADLFWLIKNTPNLDWLLLTKRVGNARLMMADAIATIDPMAEWVMPLPNVWLGATICNQEEADRDIPKLLAVPARVHYISYEPALGPVRIRDHWLIHHHPGDAAIDWVICGGESGPHARPMHPDWARSLRDQCAAAGVPFLFKQWGEWVEMNQSPDQSGDTFYSDDLSEYRHRSTAVGTDGATSHDAQLVPDAEQVFKVGKKAAGRLLDGREHNGFPSPASGGGDA